MGKVIDRLRGADVTDTRAAVERAGATLDLGKVTALPVPVDKLARRLGVQVRYTPFDGEISGMAHISDGIDVIGVNNLHHPNRQRFTLAHELGHLVLHPVELAKRVHLDRGSLYRDSLASEGTDLLEVCANAFAAELLMPRRFLDPALESGFDLEDEEQVTRLARRFRVSVAAMYFRLNRPW